MSAKREAPPLLILPTLFMSLFPEAFRTGRGWSEIARAARHMFEVAPDYKRKAAPDGRWYYET